MSGKVIEHFSQSQSSKRNHLTTWQLHSKRYISPKVSGVHNQYVQDNQSISPLRSEEEFKDETLHTKSKSKETKPSLWKSNQYQLQPTQSVIMQKMKILFSKPFKNYRVSMVPRTRPGTRDHMWFGRHVGICLTSCGRMARKRNRNKVAFNEQYWLIFHETCHFCFIIMQTVILSRHGHNTVTALSCSKCLGQ